MSNPAAADATEGARAEQQHAGAPVPDRKRVLVLASTFPRWTDDTEPPFVYNLCRSLQDDFNITVLAPHARGSKTAERWEGLEIRRFRYFWPERWQRLAYGGILPNLKRNPLLWTQVPFFLAAELISALRLIRAERPDVIHAHWLLPQGLVAAMAGFLTRKPVVVTAHGGDVYGLRGKASSAVKRWILGRVSRVTAVSRDLARAVDELTTAHPIDVDVVSMGVDTDRFHSRRNAAAVRRKLGIQGSMVLFVGRLAEKKGVRYLLDAMPAVLEQVPDATLVVVGDGPLRGELSLHARDLMLGESVRFLGARRPQDLPDLYSAADVFAGPSVVAEGGDVEGVPVSFMEAMACGCPVVASDVGGVSDLVQHEDTGLLVPQRDAGALAQAICRVLGEKDLARHLRSQAPNHVNRHFTQMAVAERFAGILRKAAA